MILAPTTKKELLFIIRSVLKTDASDAEKNSDIQNAIWYYDGDISYPCESVCL